MISENFIHNQGVIYDNCSHESKAPKGKRVPLIPATAAKLVKIGAEVVIESGLGISCRIKDEEYQEAGATIGASREDMLKRADIILRLRKPPKDEVILMKKAAFMSATLTLLTRWIL